MKFRVYHLDVKYNDFFIPINLIKKEIDPDSLDREKYELVGARRFDKKTGNIIKKYAWDSVITDMIEDGSLEPIFKKDNK